jgi:hypothetical protein
VLKNSQTSNFMQGSSAALENCTWTEKKDTDRQTDRQKLPVYRNFKISMFSRVFSSFLSFDLCPSTHCKCTDYCGPWPHSITHTLGRTPLDEWSARSRDLYLTTHNAQKRQTSIPLCTGTRNHSKRASANTRLISRDQQDWRLASITK